MWPPPHPENLTRKRMKVQGIKIRQYRDSDKREIDFLVENEASESLGIEVKSGSAIGMSDFKHLKWFSKTLSKGPFTGIVLYSGDRTPLYAYLP